MSKKWHFQKNHLFRLLIYSSYFGNQQLMIVYIFITGFHIVGTL